MDDRTLLEAAAKAAGLNVPEFESTQDGRYWVPAHGFWNPLTDDGDALRLAVKLEMLVNIGKHVTTANDQNCHVIEFVNESDPLAATRRAIVRAAAAIGGAKP